VSNRRVRRARRVATGVRATFYHLSSASQQGSVEGRYAGDTPASQPVLRAAPPAQSRATLYQGLIGRDGTNPLPVPPDYCIHSGAVL
jgi:hypothetical protein